MKTLLALLFCLTLLAPAQALAQSDAAAPAKSEQKAAKTGPTAAPYDDKLLRLSEVLGAVHYLRALCGAQEGGKWRGWMADILASEKPEPARKARLVARFNRGYKAFDQTYTACTESALLAADRYVKEGVLLSSQITNRYGR